MCIRDRCTCILYPQLPIPFSVPVCSCYPSFLPSLHFDCPHTAYGLRPGWWLAQLFSAALPGPFPGVYYAHWFDDPGAPEGSNAALLYQEGGAGADEYGIQQVRALCPFLSPQSSLNPLFPSAFPPPALPAMVAWRCPRPLRIC